MTKEQFENERKYQGTMAIAESLRRRGVISDEEYCQIDTRMKEKYRPITGDLLSRRSLIYAADRGLIDTGKEAYNAENNEDRAGEAGPD